MKKPKYFKGVSRKKKASKEPVVVKSVEKHISHKAESPKNSRAIPESHHKQERSVGKKMAIRRMHFERKAWMQVWNITAIIVLVVLGIGMTKELGVLKQKSAERAVLTKRLSAWESVAKEYPEYRDAYLSLAEISYELGDRNIALVYVDQALTLDPNNETTMQLADMIGKNR